MEWAVAILAPMILAAAGAAAPPRIRGDALLSSVTGVMRVRLRNRGLQASEVTAVVLVWGTGSSPQVITPVRKAEDKLLGELPRLTGNREGWYRVDLDEQRDAGRIRDYPITVRINVGHGLLKRKKQKSFPAQWTNKPLAAPPFSRPKQRKEKDS